MISAKVGESGQHDDITVNLVSLCAAQLKDTACRVRLKNCRVLSAMLSRKEDRWKGMIAYPDLVVICGRLDFHDEFPDVVLNPQVIIEVLSDLTASCERGDKFIVMVRRIPVYPITF